MVRYWLSRSSGASAEVGLMCMTGGSDITAPDRIIFANWKRLSDAAWDYTTSSNRNFNLMPYSINDSAVCMYYDPVDIPEGQSREIILVLANHTLGVYAESPEDPGPAASAEDSLQALRDRLIAQAGSGQLDLDDVNRFIDMIDRRLAAGQAISDEELRLMEEILSAIKDKSERYSGGR
jgi:hypothetical protein